MKSMGLTLKSGQQIGATEVKKSRTPLEAFMQKQLGEVEKR